MGNIPFHSINFHILMFESFSPGQFLMLIVPVVSFPVDTSLKLPHGHIGGGPSPPRERERVFKHFF